MSIKKIVNFTINEREKWILTDEGNDIAKSGSHEAKVFYAIPPGSSGIPMGDLSVSFN